MSPGCRSLALSLSLVLFSSGLMADTGRLSGEAATALVPFASAEGLARLARSPARSDFAPLANQFEAQATIAFSGPTTAAIVLNALDPGGLRAPRDESRLQPEDSHYLRSGTQLTVPRHTQESVIANGPEPRARVFGQPVTVDGRQERDGGFQLRQLEALLQAHQAVTRLVIVDSEVTEASVRRDLVDNLGRAGDYVIVNYLRPAVGQAGGGHISPLGAYDAETDSVLVLDVNPSHHPWIWMPLRTLVAGMRTRDHAENRGYILVTSR